MDFIMGLPRSEHKNDGILTVVDRATKMVHLVPMSSRQFQLLRQPVSSGRKLAVYMEFLAPLCQIVTPDLCPNSGGSFGEFWGAPYGCPVHTTHRLMGSLRR